ncbi:sodium/proline symporter [Caldalkalibacillus uzonensis]|uniref:Sodium/proline symporter n=1 Tax=Caldalkalibacillus uzonensis TaxID=353224 RepID=A0ABU0CU74_9BACI|nr:sodium/proline symporter [Caldalkalibacillus uzonensis]MDQ0339966.1 sodium/proline symporter [Caldalkalibacillus uzonensis]
MSTHPLTITVFILYLIMLIVIGIASAKKSSGGLISFFLAGRGLGKWTVALSAVSSGRSSWLVLGVTGIAYLNGLQAVWTVAGYIFVEIFMFFYAARRFRKYSEQSGSITIPDILETRYQDKTRVLRITSSLILIFFMIAYVGSQIVAGGTAFSGGLGLSQNGGMWLTAIILLLYTMLGGFHAVSKTDLVQAIFMLLSLVILPIIAIINIGGFGPVLEAMYAQGSSFTAPFSFAIGTIINLVGIGLASPGNPHILVRYMSLKSLKEMSQAAIIGTLWNLAMAYGAIMIGFVGRAYFPDISMLPNENHEAIFTTLGQTVLDPFTFGILVVAILAAIMSSADSQLLVGSSVIVRDIYDKIFRKGKEISEAKLTLYSRLSTVVIMLLAVWLAFSFQEFVFWMVLFAFGGLGACFGPALLLSFYWKGTTKQGILWGMIAGLITVILVKQQPQWTYAFLPDIKALVGKIMFGVTYEAVPGVIIATLVIIVVSKFTKKPDNAVQIVDDLSSYRID